MLTVLKKIVLVFLIIISIPKIVEGTEKIIESELNSLNLSSFINEGEKYTKDNLEGINIKDLLKNTVKGEFATNTIYKAFLNLLGKEIVSTITIAGEILIIIIIHSILKSVVENIGNSSISQIAYYVEYILIITLIMTSFNQVIDMVRLAISNLVGYLNILIPLLFSLIITSGTAITATTLQPIILGIIIIIGKGINLYIIPLLIIATVLGIVSNLSEKIQIAKISKLLNSGITWLIGFVFTMFVSLLSLEGTMTSSVDGLTIKGLKTATSTFVPVIGKVLGDSVETVLRCNICYKKRSWNCWNNSNNWNNYYSNCKIISSNDTL